MPPTLLLSAGHGSHAATPVLAAFRIPGVDGRQIDGTVHISDLAVTVASMVGLELRSTTVGRDLSGDWGG